MKMIEKIRSSKKVSILTSAIIFTLGEILSGLVGFTHFSFCSLLITPFIGAFIGWVVYEINKMQQPKKK
jgi:uncharacterized membrane protein YuzA (DUF378 family)